MQYLNDAVSGSRCLPMTVYQLLANSPDNFSLRQTCLYYSELLMLQS